MIRGASETAGHPPLGLSDGIIRSPIGTESARRVLILFSRVGGGHESAARALAEAFETVGRGWIRARAVDVYREHGCFPVTRFPALYAHLARYHPRLWAALFHATNAGGPLRDPSPLLRPFLGRGLRQLLATERPDLVVSVLPVINGLVAEACRALHPRPRFEVVLTDWCHIHRTWVAPGVDHYTVPTEPARQDCLRRGAPAEAVEVVGLPVRAQFVRQGFTPAERARVLGALGLPPERFTVLVMVGAEGSPRALHNLRTLAGLPLDAQLIVVCGRNARLRARAECLPMRAPRRVLGFVENVADLMRSADLLITKAGGVTLAEAFTCEVPVIVTDVLPGQEHGNLLFAARQGAVEHAPTPDRLAELVAGLRAAPTRRTELARRGRALARPDAAPRTATGMLARLEASATRRPLRPA